MSPTYSGMAATVKAVKKLIEVALPLDDINRAAAREKSIRHGHPSTLHLWWARRPLAAARAVLFAQLVDDPSGRPELCPMPEDQEQERERLFGGELFHPQRPRVPGRPAPTSASRSSAN